MLTRAKLTCEMFVFGLRIIYDVALFFVLAGRFGGRRAGSLSHVAENAAWRTTVFDVDVSDTVTPQNYQPQSDRTLVTDVVASRDARALGVCVHKATLASDRDRTR